MFRRSRTQQDFNAEIEAHIRIEADRLRATGLSHLAADAAARRAFGNSTATLERFYESSRSMWWDQLKQDLRHTVRLMARAPLLTSAILATLALGIGANTLVFSVIRAVVLRPLPYDRPEQLVQLWDSSVRSGGDWVSFPNFRDWSLENNVFQQMAAYRYTLLTLAGGRSTPESLLGLEVTGRFFDLLGVKPALGRTFLPGEDNPGHEGVAVISQALWQRMFGGDAAVTRRNVSIDGRAYTIVGVMPSVFRFPNTVPGERAFPIDLWIPFRPSPDTEQRDSFNYWAIARLIDGTSLQTAAANMDAVAAGLEQRYPETNRNRRVRMEPLRDHLNGRVRPVLMILMAAVGSLLLIACANIASLLLSRAESRRREMAVREALGAGRGRLLRQALTESLLLSGTGAASGLGLAWLGTELALGFAPSNIPRIEQTALDIHVLLFTTVVGLTAGILFGLAPALAGIRGRVSHSIKDGGTRSSAAPASLVIRHVLVGGQMALAVMMLISAGLLLRSFLNVVRLDPGVQTAQVVSGYINLAMPRYSDPAKQVAFFEEALRRIRTLPGVTSAAVSNSVPLTEINDTGSVRIDGRDPPPGQRLPSANRPHISSSYFETMGIPLVQGRYFDSRDRADGPPVAIVSDLAAGMFWPNESPMGKRVSINSVEGKRIWREVVGVVRSTRHFGLEHPLRPEVYVAHAQAPSSFMVLVVRFQGVAAGVLNACRREVAAIDPQQAIMHGGSLEELVSNAFSRRRFQSTLLTAFAVVAALLASLGIYGVTAYTVSRRAREVGIRMALGARPRDVVLMIAGTGSRTVAAGAVVGLAGAVALSRILANLLFGVSALDSWTFGSVVLLLMFVAGLALYLPSRRAAVVDPVVVLREE